MTKVDYNKIVQFQEEVFERVKPPKIALECVEFSKTLMHYAIDHDNYFPNEKITVPSTVSEAAVLATFSNICDLSPKDFVVTENGDKICILS